MDIQASSTKCQGYVLRTVSLSNLVTMQTLRSVFPNLDVIANNCNCMCYAFIQIGAQ